MTEAGAKCKYSILFSTGSLVVKNSGPYHNLREACAALRERGHSLTILGTVGKSEKLVEKDWVFADAVPFRRVGPPSWHIAPGLRSWLRKAGPDFDVVNIQSVWLMANVQVARWAYKNRIPYMIVTYGNLNGVALRYSSIKKRIARWLFLDKVFERAACVHAHNEEEYRAIRSYGITRPVCVIPTVVPVPLVKDRKTLLPENLRDRKVALYLGRLHSIKNLEGLIRAWSRLPRDRRDWRLVIVGGGAEPYRHALEDLMKHLNLQDSVAFVGYVDDESKAAWLAFASIFILPSFSEGLPMAALEAMAAGTPVLLSRSCNLSEVVEGGAGKLTEPEPEILARDLLDLLNLDHRELELMGTRARQFVETNYSRKSVCGQLEEVFRWMKEGGAIPACVRME